jgi:RNA polymerase sigma-70 factor (ECF subfamily)
MEAEREKELIQQVLQGNTAAFALLADTHKDHVFNLIIRVVRQRALAEELCQDVFIKAYRQLGQFKYNARLSTWLFRIAYNTAISALRKTQLPTCKMDENHALIEEESTQEAKEALLVLLQKAINQLPAKEAALITLFYNEDKSLEEIAQVTRLSVVNVKVRLHRIRLKLKMIMEQKNKDDDECKNRHGRIT